MKLHTEALQFLFSTHKAVLSTHSAKFEGYPFGSLTPFVLNQQGMPIILISNLAEHTKNIMQDDRVSLVVFDNNDDLQANARLTLLGHAKQTDKNNELIRGRYLRYLPQAEQYFDMHDFSFYTIQVIHARYIAGFGRMGWIDGSEITLPSNPLFIEELGILEHMNADHQESLKAFCLHYHLIHAHQVEMIGIDSMGFDVRAQATIEHVLRFNFDNPISNAQEARLALVAMTKACRP
jgi:heme iron utilization protein